MDPHKNLSTPRRTPGAPALVPSIFGCHNVVLKGEDGARAERLTIGNNVLTVCLVVDGHGGAAAAEYVIANLVSSVAKAAGGDASTASLETAARGAFQEMHDFLHDSECSGTTSGTTATLCLVNETRGEITCAYAGDSYAYLVESPTVGDPKRAPKVTPLTTSLRLQDNAEERERVQRTGGKVGQAMTPDGFPYGPLRAFPGGLACASSIGDGDCGPFVSPSPHVTSLPFPEEGGALMIASDGVWDNVSSGSAAKVALSCPDPASAAERIVAKATRAGVRDDTTCVVIVGGQSTMWSENGSDSSSQDATEDSRLPTASMSSSPPSASCSSMSGAPGAGAGSVRSGGLARRFTSIVRAPVSTVVPRRPDPSVKGGKLFESLAKGQGDTVGDLLLRSGLTPQPSDDGPCSPESTLDAHDIPLFAFLSTSPKVCISPSASMTNLSEAGRQQASRDVSPSHASPMRGGVISEWAHEQRMSSTAAPSAGTPRAAHRPPPAATTTVQTASGKTTLAVSL